MEVGDRHVIDGVEYECVSSGTIGDDGEFSVTEGRVPMPGDEGMLLAPEDDEGSGYWFEPVARVEQRARMAALEMEMDSLMPNVRRELLAYEEEGAVPLTVAAGFARAACAYGYMYGFKEVPPGDLARRAGYDAEGARPE